MSCAKRIAVLGAGIIGLSIAFELAVRRAVQVTLFDPGPAGRGASWAAAGMLAPAFEAASEVGAHPRLFDLCLASAALWPAFAADVARLSGQPSGFEPAPALAVALDDREAARLEAIAGLIGARGIACRRLDAKALQGLEPALGRAVLGGVELESDTRIDNRQFLLALITLLRSSGRVRFERGPAPLRLGAGAARLEGHDLIIAAAGWQTPFITAGPDGADGRLCDHDPDLAGIGAWGGQMLSVGAIEGAPRRVVRSGPVYLVPRAGGVVIGATMEKGRVTLEPDEDSLRGLRRHAVRLCPALAEAPETGRWAGVRPGTADHAPLIGETALSGLVVASGHYRNGILLAPVTARLIADQVLEGRVSQLAAAFRPSRMRTVPG